MIDLNEIVDGDALQEEPFSQMPLNMMIRATDGSNTSIPATYDGWKALLESTPLNATPTKMYRSKTADVLNDFRGMVEELMAA